MAATQPRLVANPSMSLLTTVPYGYRKARKTNTNPFPQKLDAARRCNANPREESRIRIADLNVLLQTSVSYEAEVARTIITLKCAKKNQLGS
jgi:hypothetical protein